jgi:phosphate transport system substrate-binding protein
MALPKEKDGLVSMGGRSMIRLFFSLLCFTILAVLPADARDRIRIVGSQEVMPFMETVAQTFSAKSANTTPVLETTGSGNGFRLFCGGIGFDHPDIIVTSRPVTDAEFDLCIKNGVEAITEIMIGHDAIVVVNSKEAQQVDFTPAQLFSALAASIEKEGDIRSNTYSKWMEIDPSLPDEPVLVMGPPTTSGMYDDFMRLIVERGCGKFQNISALVPSERYEICHSMRTDGAFIQGPRNENAALEWLQDNPSAFGITRYSFLTQNQDLITGNSIDGVLPTEANISKGSYPLTRTVYAYVKSSHVAAVEGLQDFLYELTSDHTIGPDGYLTFVAQAEFVPLDEKGRNHARDMAFSLAPMKR